MKNTTSIVFTGDIGFDKYMSGKYADEELLGGEVIEFLHVADHVVANVEGPLYKPESLDVSGLDAGAASLVHSMDPEVAIFLKRINADIWNICNNHIMDAGPLGMQATLNEAREAGARTLGNMSGETNSKKISKEAVKIKQRTTLLLIIAVFFAFHSA